jgi:uncharacterized membrane protein YfcA
MLVVQGVLICAAAFLAGVMNAIAGGGTLLTFPVLIWAGLDPKIANATSTVALWPGLMGGVFGYRHEIRDSSSILIRLGLISVVGGAVGAWLLILTPSPTFARLVPVLILFATILLMVQGPVNRWIGVGSASTASMTPAWWLGAGVFQFFSAAYGGYFGAGNGILMLAALGLLGLHDIHRANGIKNVLGMCLNSVAVLTFSVAQMVSWPRSLVMAVAAMAGGYVGARSAQRVGRVFIRRMIIGIGFSITLLTLWRLQ